jgi:hypothetical protein
MQSSYSSILFFYATSFYHVVQAYYLSVIFTIIEMVDVYAIFLLLFVLLSATIFYRNYYLSPFLNKLIGGDKQSLDGSE